MVHLILYNLSINSRKIKTSLNHNILYFLLIKLLSFLELFTLITIQYSFGYLFSSTSMQTSLGLKALSLKKNCCICLTSIDTMSINYDRNMFVQKLNFVRLSLKKITTTNIQKTLYHISLKVVANVGNCMKINFMIQKNCSRTSSSCFNSPPILINHSASKENSQDENCCTVLESYQIFMRLPCLFHLTSTDKITQQIVIVNVMRLKMCFRIFCAAKLI